jgi:hypothetical protein
MANDYSIVLRYIMFTRTNCIFVTLILLFIAPVTVISVKAQSKLEFFLDNKYVTSAGVYQPDGTLVRTLWRKVTYGPGIQSVSWDGKDDVGRPLPDNNYNFQLIYHNLQYVWDGSIGNTSTEKVGPTVHRSFFPIRDMAAIDSSVLYVAGYNEGQNNLHSFSQTNSGVQVGIGRTDAFTSITLVDADSTRIYLANNEGGVGEEAGHTSFVYALKIKDHDIAPFSAGKEVRLNGYYQDQYYASVIDLDQVSLNNAATGLAVQKNGSILAVAHGKLNVIKLFDKRNGQLLRTISATNPTSLSMAPNGNLWAIVDKKVVCYTNLTSIPRQVVSITGLIQPLALGTDPTNNDIVLVADAGTSQQLKAYNQAGTPLWTYGQLGGYLTQGNQISNDKFNWGTTSFVTINPDHSFWVSDGFNNRCLHFAANRSFLEQIMFQPHGYVAAVDANNPTRVFSEFLEFAVDYNKPLQESWTLVRNWQVGVSSTYLGFGQGIRQVVTLKNGRTYALVQNATTAKFEVVELTITGLRPTGIVFSGITEQAPTLMADGSIQLAPSEFSTSVVTWYKRELIGFDNADNPQWATQTVLANASNSDQDPVPRHSAGDVKTPITSSGVIVSFDQSKNAGWHLGGLRLGGTNWLWKASPTATLDGLGSYDNANGVQYGGNVVMTAGRSIIYGYHGEFWKGTQASQWMHFYDNGLFIGQFGEMGMGHSDIDGAVAGFAGNGFSPSTAVVNSETYMWVNDESGHGPQRWHLVGANTIREATGSGKPSGTISLVDTTDIAFPTRVIATPGKQQIKLVWSPVKGASAYTVKYALQPGGPYIVAISATSTIEYIIKGLVNGTDYYIAVAALLPTGPEVYSPDILAKPVDNNALVQAIGEWKSNATEIEVTSVPTTGQPATHIQFPMRYTPNNLLLNEIGKKGYVIYNWGGDGVHQVNIKAPFTLSTNAGWKNDAFTGYTFRVDGQLGTNSGLYSNPSGSVTITVTDSIWHYITAFCPARFIDKRNFTISLTSLDQNTPAATYTIREALGINHAVQFRFKGSVTLCVDNGKGEGGVLQAIFLDDENLPPIAGNVTNKNTLFNNNNPLSISPLTGTDTDGFVVSYIITSLPSAKNGILYFNNGTRNIPVSIGTDIPVYQANKLLFAPAAGYKGTIFFQYMALDDLGLLSSSASYTIDTDLDGSLLPIANSILNSTIPSNSTPTNLTSLSGYAPDGWIEHFTINTLPSITQGTLYLDSRPITTGSSITTNQASQLCFLPRDGYTGNAVFTYSATNNKGVTSKAATFTMPVSVPLAIELTQFTVKAQGIDAMLIWETASEIDHSFFVIERSFYGNSFSAVDTIYSQGTTLTKKLYEFIDRGIGNMNSSNNSIIYYRLKEVTNNGSTTYSPVRLVSFANQITLASIYPNPATNELYVVLSDVGARLRLYAYTGSLLLETITNTTEKIINLERLSPGIYMLLIEANNGIQRQYFVKK